MPQNMNEIMIFDTSDLDNQMLYRLLVGGVTPRPIAWISTISSEGIHNIAPYSFFNVASCNPPVLWYSQVMPRDGINKDTLNNLLATGECVVHIVSEDQLVAMNQSCANLPPDQSEFDFAAIESIASQLVTPRSVKASLIRYECTLREVLPISSLPGGGTAVLLDVKLVAIDDSIWSDNQIDQQTLKSVGKLGGDWFSWTRELTVLRRP